MELLKSLFDKVSSPYLFNIICDKVQEGIFLLDRKGTIIFSNDGVSRQLGVEKNWVGTKITEVCVPVSRPWEVLCKETEECQVTLRNLVGGSRELNALFFPVNEEYKVLIVRDYFYHKTLSDKATESELRLKAVFDTAVDGIILIDESGVIELVNPAAATLFGYSESEMVGKKINEMMPVPHSIRHDEYIDNHLKTGIKRIIGIGREVEGLRKDGSIFPFKLAVSKVDFNGKISFAGVIHDLTEQKDIELKLKDYSKALEDEVNIRTRQLQAAVADLKESERELQRALAREKELNELKSRFVSMASHEFRTPLSAILSSASLIGKYTESEQQEKRDRHIGKIKSAVSNLNMILNDFLSVEKLEKGMERLNPANFQIDEWLEEFVEDFQMVAKPGQKIVYKPVSEGGEVFLDKQMLLNILNNLVSNAIKYSPEGKEIEITSEVKEGRLLLTVKDEGMGIPKADQEHLFDRFFRAGNVTNIQGTGLGLHIMKGYVEFMGGTVSFKSEQGKGTIFKLNLPERISI